MLPATSPVPLPTLPPLPDTVTAAGTEAVTRLAGPRIVGAREEAMAEGFHLTHG